MAEQSNPALLNSTLSSDDEFEDYEAAGSPSSSSSQFGSYPEQGDHRTKIKTFQMKFTYLREPRKRTRTAPEQLDVLLLSFEKDPVPSIKERRILAEKTGMTPRSVQVWFQNRRAKYRNQAAAASSGAVSSASPSPSPSPSPLPAPSPVPTVSAAVAPLFSSVLPIPSPELQQPASLSSSPSPPPSSTLFSSLPALSTSHTSITTTTTPSGLLSNSHTGCQFEYVPFQSFIKSQFQPLQEAAAAPAPQEEDDFFSSPSLSPTPSDEVDFPQFDHAVVPQLPISSFPSEQLEVLLPEASLSFGGYPFDDSCFIKCEADVSAIFGGFDFSQRGSWSTPLLN